MPQKQSLIFVYNATPGLFNIVVASTHKLISPDTYDCALCQITHGPAGMFPIWRSYIAGHRHQCRLYYRDQFRTEHPELNELPAPFILAEQAGHCTVLLDAEAIGEIKNVSGLICRIEEELSSLPQLRPRYGPSNHTLIDYSGDQHGNTLDHPRP